MFLASTIDDFHRAAAAGDPNAGQLKSRADALRLTSLLGYAIGGAGVAGGAVMVVIGGRARREAQPAPVTVGVWGAPAAAGVAVRAPW